MSFHHKKFTHLFSQKQTKKSNVENGNLLDVAVQTEYVDDEGKLLLDWNVSKEGTTNDLVDQVTRAAKSAVEQTGLVYEATTGLYYDYNSGYYYDTVINCSTLDILIGLAICIN